MTLTPESLSDLQEAVRGHPRVRVVGARTKPRPAEAGEGVTPVCMTRLSGLVDYHAAEYTFTARAGTPLAEVEAALAEQGQYLPFDPPFRDAGATLGGTVACALSGPGRFRFGGARDFLLAVQVLDGNGALLRGGAKVVKNAAGFDLPKLLVGSMGRLGILTELTFKVFPRPAASATLAIDCPDVASALAVIARASGSRWEPDALEYHPAAREVWLRLAQPGPALDPLRDEISREWPGRVRRLDAAEADALWRSLREVSAPRFRSSLARVPATPGQVARLEAALGHAPGLIAHYGVGANLAWLSWDGPAPEALDATLTGLGLSGVLLRGEGSLHLGVRPARAIDAAVAAALDPVGRFA